MTPTELISGKLIIEASLDLRHCLAVGLLIARSIVVILLEYATNTLITYLLCALSLGVSDYLHAIPAATHSNMASRDGAQKIPVRHSAKLRWKIRWLQERQAESIFMRLSDLFCYEFALSLMGFREHDGSLKSDYLQD